MLTSDFRCVEVSLSRTFGLSFSLSFSMIVHKALRSFPSDTCPTRVWSVANECPAFRCKTTNPTPCHEDIVFFTTRIRHSSFPTLFSTRGNRRDPFYFSHSGIIVTLFILLTLTIAVVLGLLRSLQVWLKQSCGSVCRCSRTKRFL